MLECEANCQYCRNNRLDFTDRFWKKVTKTNTCWIYEGSISKHGYGVFCFMNNNVYAHRFSVSLIDKVDSSLEIDHLCRNRRCVNPKHLEQVTHKVNLSRGDGIGAKNAKKTHCKNGHIFDWRNTLLIQGGRRCRKCSNIRHKRYTNKILG